MSTTDMEPEQSADTEYEFQGLFGRENTESETGEMTLIEHLGELRQRLFISLLAVVILSIVAFIFSDKIFQFLLQPLPSEANALTQHGDKRLVVTGIGEAFSVSLKISMIIGIALATPIWIYQLWGFLAPALTRKEKKYALPFTVIGVALFIVGGAIGFVVLKYPINWLVHFNQGNFVELVTADNYFSFVGFFLLAFGLTFELPLVLTFLALVGVVTSKYLAKNRAYILVGLWVASCFITPGADPYSPVIIGVSFTVLYFLSELMIRAIGK